jgi:WD40 repeat protein
LLLRGWSADNLRSAPLSSDNALRALQLPPNTPFGVFSGIGFSPDGTLVAAAGDAGVIVWELGHGRPRVVEPPGDLQDWRDAVFTADGGTIFYSGRRSLLRRTVTRGADGNLEFGAPDEVLSGYCGDLQWIGDKLAVGGRFTDRGNPCVELLKPDGTAEPPLVAHAPPDLLAASADGRWLAASRYPGGGGTLWDLSVDPPVAKEAPSDKRCAFGFTPDSATLITGTDTTIRFASPFEPARETARQLRRKHSQFTPARSISCTATNLTAVCTGPNEVTLCDSRTLQPLFSLDSPLTPFDCSPIFSPDGTKLALAGGVSRVVVWDLAHIREELVAMGLGW